MLLTCKDDLCYAEAGGHRAQDPQREYVNHWLRGERKAVLRPGPNSEDGSACRCAMCGRGFCVLCLHRLTRDMAAARERITEIEMGLEKAVESAATGLSWLHERLLRIKQLADVCQLKRRVQLASQADGHAVRRARGKVLVGRRGAVNLFL